MAYIPGYWFVDLPEEEAFALADEVAAQTGKAIHVKRWFGGSKSGKYYFDDQPKSRPGNTVLYIAGNTRAEFDKQPGPQPEFGVAQDQQIEAPTGESSPDRAIVESKRVIRDTKVMQWVKRKYDYHCQVCNLRLELSAGPYAEGAHIKPLGSPHDGPDTPQNMLCLCPNHHVLFDGGTIAVKDDYQLIGADGRLIVKPSHDIDIEFLKYHRNNIHKVRS